MNAITFVPYWRQIDQAIDPYSFVFFVVAKIAGHHRPIAVVSNRATADLNESLQGAPLLTACQKILTIFADSTNHAAIRAELSLATTYYMRDGGRNEYHPEVMELPENTSGYYQPRMEPKPWGKNCVHEFPFISACLLQGVALCAEDGENYEPSLEPLGTVYRDTNVEWGMVVIDITDLSEPRYDISSLDVGPFKFASSREEIRRQIGPGIGMGNESGGIFRVRDQVRRRVVMSAADYLTKVPGQVTTQHQNAMIERLASIPLVHTDALEFIWPVDLENPYHEISHSMAGLSLGQPGVKKSLHEQAVRSLLQSRIDVDDFTLKLFDDVRQLPYFQEILQRNLLEDCTRCWNTRSAGLLVRLAFNSGQHLSLELVHNVSVEAVIAALNVPELAPTFSLVLCTTSIRNLSSDASELIEGLSHLSCLSQIYFMQSPLRESDAPDYKLFEALARRPEFLSRVKVVFAGSYSAALRKDFWLPISASPTGSVQIAPLSLFPVQQILHRYRYQMDSYDTVYLGDSLLSPERFATGFLTYLRTSNPQARLFSFSTALASLSHSTLTSAEISPIPAESFAIGSTHPPNELDLRVQDLVPDGWTVLVSSEIYRSSPEGAMPLWGSAEYGDYLRQRDKEVIRYALVRPRKQIIKVDEDPSVNLLDPEFLEVVGLTEFLAIEAPEIDSDLVERRLAETAEHLTSRYNEGALPPGIQKISVLGHDDAVTLLLECLKGGREVNER